MALRAVVRPILNRFPRVKAALKAFREPDAAAAVVAGLNRRVDALTAQYQEAVQKLALLDARLHEKEAALAEQSQAATATLNNLTAQLHEQEMALAVQRQAAAETLNSLTGRLREQETALAAQRLEATEQINSLTARLQEKENNLAGPQQEAGDTIDSLSSRLQEKEAALAEAADRISILTARLQDKETNERLYGLTVRLEEAAAKLGLQGEAVRGSEQAIRDLAGLHYFRNGQLDKAIELFKGVYERNPDKMLHLGEYVRALAAAGRWDEIEKVSREVDLRDIDCARAEYLHDFSPLERRIVVEVCLDSYQSSVALAQLSRAVAHIVEKNIAGDIVECGVFKGASAICIIRTLQHLGVSDRHVWLYDTYEGMPQPEEVDVFYKGPDAEYGGIKTWERLKRNDGSGGSDWAYGPIQEVRSTVLRTGYPESHIHFVKGMVEDTIPQTMPDSIALLRLDTDFYRSTKHELEHLYPRLVPGGILILDDYGCYQGARTATDEYFAENSIDILLARVDEHVRLAVKPYSQPVSLKRAARRQASPMHAGAAD